MPTSMRASAAGSFDTLGPGSSTRHTGASPRAWSSRRTTSLSGLRAGTSSWKRWTAPSMSVLVSAGVTRPLDLVALQELLPDHHALDLGRALADQEQWCVAIEPLDLVLLRVAVAAVDAEGVLDDFLPRLRRVQLRHAGLEVRTLAGVLEPRRLEGEQARGLDLGRHVGQLELDRLVLGDLPAEGLALLRVAQGQLERALCDTDAPCGDVDPAHLERV